jgi:hypothetical protein
MQKPDTIKFELQISSIREEIRNYLVDFLKDTSFDEPYECEIPLHQWCSVGLSTLNMFHITGMCLDENQNIWLRWEDMDECGADFNEFSTDDLLDLIEGVIS